MLELNQLIIDEGNKYTSAIDTLTKGRYVDDVFGRQDTIEKCVELVKQVDHFCSAGFFPLEKWIRNNQSVQKIPVDFHEIKDLYLWLTQQILKLSAYHRHHPLTNSDFALLLNQLNHKKE